MMTEHYYRDRLRELADIERTATGKKIEWTYRLLFLSATLFGILISLCPKFPDTRLPRLCFAVSILSLAAGVILLGTVLSSLYGLYRRSADQANRELQTAIRENRKPDDKGVSQSRFFVRCETAAYIFLLLSVLLLSCYILLVSVF